MDSRYIRYNYCLKSNISHFYSTYKKIFWICILSLIVGIVFGVLNCGKYAGDIELSNMLNVGIVDMLKGDKSGVGLFWFPLIKYLIFCILIVCTNNVFFKKILSFIGLIVCGYVVAFDLSVFVLTYGFLGVVNVIIFFIPFQLLFWLCLVAFCCVSTKEEFCCKSQNCSLLQIKNCIWLIVLAGAICLFLKYLCLPAIRITIIVN